MTGRSISCAFLLFLCASSSQAGGTDTASYTLPLSVSAGMGANYLNPQDVIEMINGTYVPSSRVGQFAAAVDFFGAINVPVSPDWVVQFEYAYSITTFNISSQMFGASEFTLSMHMPTILLQYVVVATPLYHLKVGMGGGIAFGGLDVRYWGLDASYSARGPSMAFGLEGQTALSEHLFVYLGANARWAFVGELKNSAGRTAGVNVRGEPVSMNQFSVGARLGFSYSF